MICGCEKVTFLQALKSNFLHHSCANGRKPAASMPMAATFEPHDLTCVLLTCVDLHDLRFTPADSELCLPPYFSSVVKVFHAKMHLFSRSPKSFAAQFAGKKRDGQKFMPLIL